MSNIQGFTTSLHGIIVNLVDGTSMLFDAYIRALIAEATGRQS